MTEGLYHSVILHYHVHTFYHTQQSSKRIKIKISLIHTILKISISLLPSIFQEFVTLIYLLVIRFHLAKRYTVVFVNLLSFYIYTYTQKIYIVNVNFSITWIFIQNVFTSSGHVLLKFLKRLCIICVKIIYLCE